MLFSWLRKIAKSQQNIEKRKSYRYRIPKALSASLEIEWPRSTWKALEPINFNEHAIAARGEAAAEKFDFKEPLQISCRLRVAERTIEFRGEPLRYDDHFVVLKYVDLTPESLNEITSLFPVVLGLTLEKQDLDVEGTRWYHGDNDTDFFVRFAKDQSTLHSLTLVSENNYAYWNEAEGFKTATILRETYAEGLDFAARRENPLQMDGTPDLKKLERFHLILAHSNLAEPDKQSMQAPLENALGRSQGDSS